MNKEAEIQEIALKLQKIIHESARDKLESSDSDKNFKELSRAINHTYEHAKEMHQSSSELGFKVNEIEAEGFLRCATHLKIILDKIEKK